MVPRSWWECGGDLSGAGLRETSRRLFVTCSAVGIAFAFGCPLGISVFLNRGTFPGGRNYSAVFWGVLLIAMVATRVWWQAGRRQWWKPMLRGITAGYVSSIVAYIALTSSRGRLDNLLNKPTDILYVLIFLVVICGWLLGAIAGLCEHFGDRYFQPGSAA